MFRFKILLSFIFSLLILFANAQQNASISGIVTDNSGLIVGASVFLKGTKTGTVTDNKGYFELNNVASGTYIIVISIVGYETKNMRIILKAGEKQNINISLTNTAHLLNDVNVRGKTTTQNVKESAFAVNAIDVRKFANTTADLNQILNRGTGVKIRESGGMGSNFNFSINGLSGKQVKFFVDGIPMDVMGSTMSLNNVPVNLADRMEVYKGVVPVELGADAMGGAVNVITNQKITSFLDVSHSYGSFNTNRSALLGQWVDQKTGIVLKASGFFNSSDNNYKVKDVDILEGGTRVGNQITDLNGAEFVNVGARHFHDDYQSAMGQLEVGIANKKFADALFVGVGYTQANQQMQTGFDQSVVYGGVTRASKALSGSVRYKKDNLFVQGLNLSAFISRSNDKYTTTDTLMRKYYWDGTWTKNSTAEMGSIKTIGQISRPRTYGRANLSYALNKQHSFNVNYTLDHLKNESYNELLVDHDQTPGVLNKQIVGIAYQQQFFDGKLTNTFFGKYFNLFLERPKYISNVYTLLDTASTNYGYGVASRYKILPDLGIKASFEHAYRLQEAEEMFGDGMLVQSNPDLRPESSNNINLGGFYGAKIGKHQFFIEAAGFYRNAIDFIYTVPDQRSKFLKNENKSNVRITGFESEVRYNYADFISININATYQNAINTTKFSKEGNTIPEATYLYKLPNQPWLYGNFDFSIGKNDMLGKETRIQFNWFTQYVNWFYLTWANVGNLNGKDNIPTQFIHNAAVSYSIQNGKYNLSAECRNLTNEDAFDNFRLQKPGRSFAIKFRYFIK